jgi:hypothetical protein
VARRGRHGGGDRTPQPEVDPYLEPEGHPEPAQPAQQAGYEQETDGDADRAPDHSAPDHSAPDHSAPDHSAPDHSAPDRSAEGQADVDKELGPELVDEPAASGDDDYLGERDQGPFDATELDMEQTDAVGRLDFGSVRVPMPDEAKLQVESAPGGRLKAVHILVPLGRLSISALAAPRSEPLWPDLANEIVAALKQDGAWVRWEPGLWGRELVAGTPTAQCRFIGVDGPRWMLYGVATGPAGGVDELTDVLRDMIRGTIVVRDEQPYPVRTVLPLTAPPHLSAQLEKLQTAEPTDPEVAPPVEPELPVTEQLIAQPMGQQPVPPAPPASPITPAPLAPPPAAPPPVAPAQPVSTESGGQRHDAGPLNLGRLPRHVPGQRGAGVPTARRSEHSNPGSPAPLSLQPDSPWTPQRPGSADPQQSRRHAGPQQPPRGVRRPPRRPADEHGVPTPPSWRAIDPVNDPVNDPVDDWPKDSAQQQPDPLGADPVNPPLGGDEQPPAGELPAPSTLDDEPPNETPSEHSRRSGRHRLPD